ncbi:TPA: autotransporter outer membrane beta-barrel domain-containing protein [Stenotrophomonas maltophilia]|nr:autotransporter outer membrane beta-barrel domain-containing protein [Stenotrophomonas maltophilia]HDS1024092.1 autotransporter outer membrane beta-barrel domain-containing protein [Stenotrophomonas maltophilia]HDS1028413.1 autotransporter outer membrane beta-barrel domain-containing protein [Stenotrophomonas maltophilia]HDS1032855.1 autotransporter outer membrane beta-barrel domain-containing protein [Stenotrophomonas maltophilia]
MRTTLSCARRVLSLSVAAALSAPFGATAAAPVVADGTAIALGNDTIAGSAGQYQGHAMQALNGGTINASGMTLSTSGAEAHAAYANGAGSVIHLDNSTITTSGYVGQGVVAAGGGQVNADGVQFTSTGNNGRGIASSGAGSIVNFNGGSITTNAAQFADGVRADNGGTVNIGRDSGGNGTSITIAGGAWGGIVGGGDAGSGTLNVDGATVRGLSGLLAQGSGAALNVTDSTIETRNVAVSVDAGSQARLEGVVIRSGQNGRNDGTGVKVENGAHVDVVDSSISTLGDLSHGIHAQTGGTATASNTDIVTAGGEAYGLLVDGAGSRVEFIGGSITTAGESADGVKVANGGSALIDGTTILTSAGGLYTNSVGAELGGQLDVRNSTIHNVGSQAENEPTHGVDSRDAGSVVNVSDTSITMEGRRGSGLFANIDGVLNAIRTTVNTTGNVGHGLLMGQGATASLADSSINTSGFQANGAQVTGGNATITGTDITTTGDFASGVVVLAAGSRVDLGGGNINTSGVSGFGLETSAGTIAASGVNITTAGTGAIGAYAHGTNARIELDNSSIRINGNAAHGAAATGGAALVIKDSSIASGLHNGVTGRDAGTQIAISGSDVASLGIDSHSLLLTGGAHADVQNSHLSTQGDRSRGVWAAGSTASISGSLIETAGDRTLDSAGNLFGPAAVVASSGGQVQIQSSDLSTTGYWADGIDAEHDGSFVSMTGGSIHTTGDSSKGAAAYNGNNGISLDGVRVLTEGKGAQAAAAAGVGSALTITGSQLTTLGEAAHGLEGRTGAQLTVSGTQVSTQGLGANAVRASDGARIALSASTLRADAASALSLDASTLTGTDGMFIEGNGTLAEFGSDTANTLVFDRNVVALGDIRFAAGALDSDGNGVLDRTSTLSLDNNSYWKGATDAIGDLSLANGSRWDVTGNSQVGSLSLANSRVVFDHADGQYKTLTVDGNFHADNGLLAMNTTLGDDTSPTDLLHVKGDTSGNANIAVTNIGGTGAQTEDGIKLVQVDGVSAGEYALAGRAVGGAYEYFLYQGGKADPNDGDWYLRSELSKIDPPVVPPVDPCMGADCPVEPVIDPPVTPTPVFRPEAGAYLANQASALGLFNMDLHERVGEPNLAQRQRGDGNLGSAWARVTAEQPRYRVNDQLTGQGRQNVVQIGSDLTFWGKQDRGVVGVMAGSGRATNRITSQLTGYGAEGRVDGKSLGVYSTWIQDAEDDDGLYIDGWLQAAQFKNRVQGDALAREQYRSRSLSASVEAGYALRLHQNETSALYLEPQVQAIWADYRMDGGQHQEVNGTVMKTAEAGGLQTRVGARLYGHSTAASGNRVQPFVAVNWIRNGSDANAVWMGEQRLQGIVPKDVYEAKVGAQLQLSPNLTGWGELSTQRGDYGFRSVGGQLGVKYAW